MYLKLGDILLMCAHKCPAAFECSAARQADTLNTFEQVVFQPRQQAASTLNMKHKGKKK